MTNAVDRINAFVDRSIDYIAHDDRVTHKLFFYFEERIQFYKLRAMRKLASCSYNDVNIIVENLKGSVTMLTTMAIAKSLKEQTTGKITEE